MIDAAKIEELPGLLANQVVREVAELPDRTSPDDMPDMLMVTAQELHGIVAAVEATRIRALSAEKISADAYWQRKLLNWQKDEEALSTALASSEALVAELREKVERLTKALEPFRPIIERGLRDSRNYGDEVQVSLHTEAMSFGDLRRARSELEAGHE